MCKLVQPLFAHRSLWRSASPNTFKMSHRARPGPPLTQRGSCTSGHHGKSPQSGTAALLPRICTQGARGVEHLHGQAGCKAVLPLSCLDLSCLVLSCLVLYSLVMSHLISRPSYLLHRRRCQPGRAVAPEGL